MPTPSEPMFIACAIDRVRVKAQALGLDPDEVVREAADKARTSATLVTAADEIIARALRGERERAAIMPNQTTDLDRLREALERHADVIRNPQLPVVDQVITLLDDYRLAVELASECPDTLERLGL